MNISFLQLTGFDESHLRSFEEGNRTLQLIDAVYQDWQHLVQQAQTAGFAPFIVSAYRSYDRQAAIWSAKACGERAVVDDTDQVVDLSLLSDIEKIQAIMRFSALPGCSRHHWGTDFDIADAASLPEGYRLQLTPSETRRGGVMADFYEWLDETLSRPTSAFYRPYAIDRGGVAEEPWHLSHKQLGKQCAANMSKPQYFQLVQQSGLPLADTVSQHFDEIYPRFIEVGS